MLLMEDWMDIHLLEKQGHSQRQIATLTGFSRNTVSKLLKLSPAEVQTRSYKARPSKLLPFQPYLKSRYEEYELSAVRLLAEIQAQGYTGSIDVLRRYLQTLRPYKKALEKATVRYETPPGEQAQADWAYCGRFLDPNGETVPIYAFVMVLGFSRLLYVEFTTSMDLPVLIQCHLNAFQFFGGWPSTILYDNMKQVKLGPSEFNPLFLDFAHHYGILVKTHRIRRPRTKGKVERMVDYVKDNFLKGRSFEDLPALNAHARSWLEHTANIRIHATTHQRPVDLWALEKDKLTALTTISAYQVTNRQLRKVSTESFVHFQGSRYSVPLEMVGQSVIVEVRQGHKQVLIRSNDLIIAEHALATKRGESLTKPAHLQALWKLTLTPKAAPLPPPPHYHLTFNEAVATRPLSHYEEVSLR